MKNNSRDVFLSTILCAFLYSLFAIFPLLIPDAAYADKSDLILYDGLWLHLQEMKALGINCGNCSAVTNDLQYCNTCSEYRCTICQPNTDVSSICSHCKTENSFQKLNFEDALSKAEVSESAEPSAPKLFAYCDNESCHWKHNAGKSDVVSAWNKHKEECPKRATGTCKKCQQLYYVNKKHIHDKDICPKREETCQVCQRKLPLDQLGDTHQLECQLYTLQQLQKTNFKCDSHKPLVDVLERILSAMAISNDNLKSLQHQFESELHHQKERMTETLSNSSLSDSHIFNIDANNLENRLTHQGYYLGQSSNFTFDDTYQEEGQSLLILISPSESNRDLPFQSQPPVCSASIWLMDHSRHENNWTEKLDGDIRLIVIVPPDNTIQSHKVPHQAFSHAQTMPGLPPSKRPHNPTYKLGEFASWTTYKNLLPYLHRKPGGGTYFKVAITPRTPLARDTKSIPPEFIKSIEKVDNDTLRLNLPVHLFSEHTFYEHDKNLFAKEAGLYFKVGEETWHTYIHHHSGQNSIAFNLHSSEYHGHLQRIKIYFTNWKNGEIKEWPITINMDDKKDLSNFSRQVKGSGYSLAFPMEIFTQAKQEGYFKGDRVLLLMTINAQEFQHNQLLEVIDDDNVSLQSQPYTLHEKLKLANFQSKHFDTLQAEKLKELNEELLLGKELDKLGQFYSGGNIVGTITRENSLYIWHAPELKGYSHLYNVVSPRIEHGNADYKIRIRPNRSDAGKLAILLEAHDSNSFPSRRDLAHAEIEVYHTTRRQWSSSPLINLNVADKGIFTTNKDWQSIRGAGLFIVVVDDSDYFSKTDGIKIKIKLLTKSEEAALPPPLQTHQQDHDNNGVENTNTDIALVQIMEDDDSSQHRQPTHPTQESTD